MLNCCENIGCNIRNNYQGSSLALYAYQIKTVGLMTPSDYDGTDTLTMPVIMLIMSRARRLLSAII